MYIISKKSTVILKLIDNLIVSPGTSTVYGKLRLTAELGSFWIEAAIVCYQRQND